MDRSRRLTDGKRWRTFMRLLLLSIGLSMSPNVYRRIMRIVVDCFDRITRHTGPSPLGTCRLKACGDWRPQVMKHKSRSKRRVSTPKSILRLPDPEAAKSAVLNSLSCPDAQRGYRHVIGRIRGLVLLPCFVNQLLDPFAWSFRNRGRTFHRLVAALRAQEKGRRPSRLGSTRAGQSLFP
jgi:hypothetical protein